MNYKILLSHEAKACLQTLDGRTKDIIARKIESLKESPDKKGKPLSGDLSKYRSIHAAGRYRILYEVKATEVIVFIIAVGIRKEGSKIDVYETMKKLMRLKILEK
ncbi:MAG: type II toxin-antitoxin system mRNA interferase toxin, RelE/StbE family [Deltaproteobacteria bacterium]|nr:type II toxin-antitoxin system mRNA interferase toxin, RelE/StbE family [Deltaproteobacteria bacterium]